MPMRAEPLYELAYRMRVAGRYELGYVFARQAAEIPAPVGNCMFVDTIVYSWCALDEQAVCASRIGRYRESFDLCRRLLTIAGINEADRARIAANRDLAVRELLEYTDTYPRHLVGRPRGPRDAEFTFSLTASSDPRLCERTLNSFLQCCNDIDMIGRFLVLDLGLSAGDRAELADRYPFLEFLDGTKDMTYSEQMERLQDAIGGRYWLHSGEGWQYFASDPLITRLSSVLHAEPGVSRVGINYRDAIALIGAAAPADTTRTATGTGRYVLTDTVSEGPNMVDLGRLTSGERTGSVNATLDEVLCIKTD